MADMVEEKIIDRTSGPCPLRLMILGIDLGVKQVKVALKFTLHILQPCPLIFDYCLNPELTHRNWGGILSVMTQKKHPATLWNWDKNLLQYTHPGKEYIYGLNHLTIDYNPTTMAIIRGMKFGKLRQEQNLVQIDRFIKGSMETWRVLFRSGLIPLIKLSMRSRELVSSSPSRCGFPERTPIFYKNTVTVKDQKFKNAQFLLVWVPSLLLSPIPLLLHKCCKKSICFLQKSILFINSIPQS